MQNLKDVKIESEEGVNDEDPIERVTKNRTTYPAEVAENGSIEEERNNDHVSATRTNSVEEEERPSRRSGAVRRHSFNSVGRRPREPGGSLAERAVASWYQDSGSSDSGVRTSDICEEGFFSDSEGGLSPFKNRIRGLLGSFGKGKKKGNKKGPARKQLEMSLSGDSRSEATKPDISIGQFTEMVQGLTSTASVTSEEDGLINQGDNLRRSAGVLLRSRNRVTFFIFSLFFPSQVSQLCDIFHFFLLP